MAQENKVQWVYSARNNEELADRYDQWAKDYDRDLEEDFGWTGPLRTSEVLAGHVPREARVLDAGAGTGLVGQILSGMGYGNLVAMDLSRGMLEESRKKGVYRELHQMVMGEPLDFATGAFDAVISVGVLTVGHAPASSLDELVRVTKSGGHIVFSLRPDVWEDSGFKEKQERLVADGKWQLAEVTEPFQPLPKGEPEVFHQVWGYRVI
jgi:SAM-dependent methyltransferase